MVESEVADKSGFWRIDTLTMRRVVVVVVHGIEVFESSNISRSGCASTAIATETMTTERSWPTDPQ